MSDPESTQVPVDDAQAIILGELEQTLAHFVSVITNMPVELLTDAQEFLDETDRRIGEIEHDPQCVSCLHALTKAARPHLGSHARSLSGESPAGQLIN